MNLILCRPRRLVGFTMLLLGALLIARPLAHAAQSQVSAREARSVWAAWKRSHARPDAATAPKPGDPVFWLRIPSCKISTLVLQESDADALHRYPGTRQLDSGGRVAFAHRDMHFRPLAMVRVGDEINTESADGILTRYTVQQIQILLPEQVPSALAESDTPDALHLLTCYPFRYIGPAPKRFLVTARAKAPAH